VRARCSSRGANGAAVLVWRRRARSGAVQRLLVLLRTQEHKCKQRRERWRWRCTARTATQRLDPPQKQHLTPTTPTQPQPHTQVPNIARAEYTLLDINEEGFCTLMMENGDTREDLQLPRGTDEAEKLAESIKEQFAAGQELVVGVLKAMGEVGRGVAGAWGALVVVFAALVWRGRGWFALGDGKAAKNSPSQAPSHPPRNEYNQNPKPQEMINTVKVVNN